MIRTASRFLRNFSYNLFAEASVRVGNYLLVIMISRMLEVSAAGVFTTGITYLSIGLLFSYWGFANTLTREVARDPSTFSRQFSNSLVLRIGFSIITTFVVVGLVYLLRYEAQTSEIFMLLSLSILAGSINQLISSAFMAFEKIKYLSIVATLFSVVKVGLGYLFLSQQGGLRSIAILLVASDYLTLGIYGWLLKKYLPRIKFAIDPKFSWQLVKIAFPFFSVGLVTLLDSRTEIVIISLFLGDTQVGYYTAVNTIMGLLILFPESIRYTLLPLLSRFYVTDESRFRQAIMLFSRSILLVALPVSILIFFFSSELITGVFTRKFSPSVSILQIVAWSFISYFLSVISTRSLVAINQEKTVARVTLISALITNGLNLVVAPLVGLAGVAYVRLGTSILLYLMCGYFLAKASYAMFDWPFLWRIMATGAAMAAGMALTIDHSRWLALMVGIVLFATGILLFKIIGRKEIETARLVLRSRFSPDPGFPSNSN